MHLWGLICIPQVQFSVEKKQFEAKSESSVLFSFISALTLKQASVRVIMEEIMCVGVCRSISMLQEEETDNTKLALIPGCH